MPRSRRGGRHAVAAICGAPRSAAGRGALRQKDSWVESFWRPRSASIAGYPARSAGRGTMSRSRVPPAARRSGRSVEPACRPPRSAAANPRQLRRIQPLPHQWHRQWPLARQGEGVERFERVGQGAHVAGQVAQHEGQHVVGQDDAARGGLRGEGIGLFGVGQRLQLVDEAPGESRAQVLAQLSCAGGAAPVASRPSAASARTALMRLKSATCAASSRLDTLSTAATPAAADRPPEPRSSRPRTPLRSTGACARFRPPPTDRAAVRAAPGEQALHGVERLAVAAGRRNCPAAVAVD